MRGLFFLEEAPDRFWTSARATWVNAAQAVAWLALALWRLPRASHFHYDEAFFYDHALAVARSGVPAADGPYISGTSPVALIPGGGYFDLISPPFLFTRDPVWGAAWIALLSAAGLILLNAALSGLGASGRMRVLAGTLATWTLWHARFADRIWAAHAFLFATPLLLWLSVRVRSRARPAWAWALGWGLGAALLMQIHLTAAVPIALCAAVAWPGLGSARERAWAAGAALAGVGIAYLPWLWAHGASSAGLAVHLLRTGPQGSRFGVAVGRAFAAFPKFISHGGQLPERLPAGATWLDGAGLLSFWALTALTALGFGVRGPWRAACLAGVVLLPAFLAATGRDYYDQYAIASFPFFALPAAAALSWLAGRSRALGGAVAAFAAAFVAVGVLLLWRDYRPGAHPFGLARQLEIARQLGAHGPVYGAAPGSPLAEEPLVYEVLAKDYWQTPLRFDAAGPACELGDDGAGQPRVRCP